jgi:hypothetical protein
VLDVLTFIVFGILIAAAIFVVAKLGSLPGKLARQRGHPQADAINVAGWLGLFTAGVIWVIAMIWAFTKPPRRAAAGAGAVGTDSDPGAGLQVRVAVLEAEIERLKREKEPKT